MYAVTTGFRARDRTAALADENEEAPPMTRLRYYAELEIKGPLALGEPLLRRMFQRIGDDATRDLPATVDRLA